MLIGVAAVLVVLSTALFALFYGLRAHAEELLQQAVAEFGTPGWDKLNNRYATASNSSSFSIVGSAASAVVAGALALTGRLRTSSAGWQAGGVVVLVAAGLAFLASGGLIGWWALRVFVHIATHP